jgi:hypothetical protein
MSHLIHEPSSQRKRHRLALHRGRSGRFDFDAKRRREIERHARHVGAAETEDFERWLVAWHKHNPKAKDPIFSLMEAAKRMGGDISEAEAVEVAQQAYPTDLAADAMAAWLGVSYPQRQALRLTTIGSTDIKKRAREELRKRKDRLYQERKRRERGAHPQAQSLSRSKPWEAMGISRRTWYRRIADTFGTTSSAAFFIYTGADFSVPKSFFPFSTECSSRKATSIRADDANSSARERPFQVTDRPPDYDPVTAALARRAAYRNGAGSP